MRDLLPSLLSGVSFLGLVLLLGGVLTRRWLTPGIPRLRVVAAGPVLLLLAWGGQMLVTLSSLGVTASADLLAYLTATVTGRATLLGLLGTLLLLAAELSRWSRGVLLGAAALTLWGAAGIGHGAGHGAWVRALHALHAGAMTVWLGGVLALALTRPLTVALARRFSPVALGSVVVLAASGLLMTGQHLTALTQWGASPYGQTLFVKVILVGLTLLAAVAVRRAFARPTGRRSALTCEVGLLLAVLGATALLTTQAPPSGHPGMHQENPSP